MVGAMKMTVWIEEPDAGIYLFSEGEIAQNRDETRALAFLKLVRQ